MIELRQASKVEMLGDEQSAKNANTGSAFSKIQQIFIFRVTLGQIVRKLLNL
jgi:hypothetical protein